MKKAVIIGGGFAGCAMSHQLNLLGGWDVKVVEASSFLGAGVRTFHYGGHPYTFGPRHFLSPYKKVYDYLKKIIPLELHPNHEFLTYVEKDNEFYNYPINMSDVKTMKDYDVIEKEMKEKRTEIKGAIEARNLEEYWVKSVGETLFNKFIKNYNKKMWLVDDCKKIDTFNWSPKGVALKEGSKAAWDTAISGYPIAKNGYDDYFDIATKDSEVLFNTKVENCNLKNKELTLSNKVTLDYDILINTISPDFLLDQKYGELKFIGRDFHKIVLPVEEVFPKNVYFLYYANDEKFTRIVEYKKFTKHKSKSSLIGMEIPSLNNGKLYPLPFKDEQMKAQKYFDNMGSDVFCIGRAGSYYYGVDIDDCIRQAMIIAEDLKNNRSQEYVVPGKEYQFPELKKLQEKDNIKI
jgi:UDP-galactopyranose mutase